MVVWLSILKLNTKQNLIVLNWHLMILTHWLNCLKFNLSLYLFVIEYGQKLCFKIFKIVIES